MSNIVMWDSAYNDQLPPGGQAYAGYVDGRIGSQPNYQWIAENFPAAHRLSIALFAASDADCLDIEPGAASPSDAVAWYGRQKARGIARPCFYASASTMESGLLPVIRAAGFPREEIRLWSAHYGAGEHICGPSSCGLMSMAADGTQWADNALGRDLDQSLLLPGFFGTQNWTEKLMQSLPTIREGNAGNFVRTAQALCCARGQATGIDGSFGPKTTAAVRAVQSRAGAAADGIVGPATWAVLVAGTAS